jgi:hypothetical protein
MPTKRQQCNQIRGQRTRRNVQAKPQDGEWLVKWGMPLHVTMLMLPPFFQHA